VGKINTSSSISARLGRSPKAGSLASCRAGFLSYKAVTYKAVAIVAIVVKRTKAAARQKADSRQPKSTSRSAAAEYFKALCVPPDVIPGLVAKVGQGTLFAECDRLADEWRRKQGGRAWLEILRGKPPLSLPSLASFRAQVALWRGWYLDSPGDFLDLAGKLRDLWNQARYIEGMSPPPPLPAAALGVMPGRDRKAVEVALAGLESLLRWCDGTAQPDAPDGEAGQPAATDTAGESNHVWLSAAEAAAYVGRCPKTVMNWIRGGKLQSYGQAGARYRFLKSELEAKKTARKPRKPR
jgi:hypothetical protein